MEKRVLLMQIKENESNPRVITAENLDKLINSLLVFPKMLTIRKPVVTKDGVILGGNMRSRALHGILAMGAEELTDRVKSASQRRKLSEIEVNNLISHWQAWQKQPEVDVIEEDFATAEIPQFVIKDNISAGDWDYDALDNFDAEDLEEWGVQTWGSIDDYMDYSDTGAEVVQDERQRVIITYPRERQAELEEILGHEIERPNYRLEELQ